MAVGRSLLVLLAVQTALAAAESVQLSIHRRSPPAVRDTAYYARSAERLRMRYAPVADDFSTSKRAIDLSGGADVPLLNQVSIARVSPRKGVQVSPSSGSSIGARYRISRYGQHRITVRLFLSHPCSDAAHQSVATAHRIFLFSSTPPQLIYGSSRISARPVRRKPPSSTAPDRQLSNSRITPCHPSISAIPPAPSR
jgi:hypothetical protein